MKELVLTLTLVLLSPIFALPTIANPTDSEQAASDKYAHILHQFIDTITAITPGRAQDRAPTG
jgi:hypothetical protein